MTKKQSATVLLEAFITGIIMMFLPKEHWGYQAFMWYKLIIGSFGVLLLLFIGILSSKE